MKEYERNHRGHRENIISQCPPKRLHKRQVESNDNSNKTGKYMKGKNTFEFTEGEGSKCLLSC